MNKKILAGWVCALAAGALSAQAQTEQAPAPQASPPPAAAAAPAGDSLSLTVTPSYVSTYMFRGQRLSGQAFQPSVEADWSNLAVGVWASTPWNSESRVPGQSDPEIDPYGSYTFNLNGSMSLQPGFTLYTYANAPTNAGYYRSTFEPNVAFNYTVAGFKFTPKFYYDAVLDGPTYEFSTSYAVPLRDIGSELDFMGTAGRYDYHDALNHSGIGTEQVGSYWLLGVSAPFTITKHSKLTVGWAYTKGDDAYFKQGILKVGNTAAVGRGVASVSYAWTF